MLTITNQHDMFVHVPVTTVTISQGNQLHTNYLLFHHNHKLDTWEYDGWLNSTNWYKLNEWD